MSLSFFRDAGTQLRLERMMLSVSTTVREASVLITRKWVHITVLPSLQAKVPPFLAQRSIRTTRQREHDDERKT